jgi:hypothetical protein
MNARIGEAVARANRRATEGCDDACLMRYLQRAVGANVLHRLDLARLSASAHPAVLVGDLLVELDLLGDHAADPADTLANVFLTRAGEVKTH